ncbi:MAG: DNA-directed RNA polymerase subunit alpha, partial [Emcibacteraceae bacterium]|nr:DNA-directed RNA polymerase subunit alpha [Emcibacteraceae bacterium]
MIQNNWQELIKPTTLDIIQKGEGRRKATVVAEPLERGFGMTLGNALRRVLLSSLQGAAVTSVHIDNVLHEFSSIAGVREDVTDIILNIKKLAVSVEEEFEGTRRLTLQATGPGEVTAAAIEEVNGVTIHNPDLVICNLDNGADLRMELTVSTGKGYVAAVKNRADDAPIGLIPVDSLFSPVTRV